SFAQSSPALGPNGTIYVGGTDSQLYAVDKDGNTVWAFPADDAIYSSPAVSTDGAVIYCATTNGTIYAVNAGSGKERWNYPAGASAFFFSSPAIGADGTVYIGGEDGNLYAINPNGTLAW